MTSNKDDVIIVDLTDADGDTSPPKKRSKKASAASQGTTNTTMTPLGTLPSDNSATAATTAAATVSDIKRATQKLSPFTICTYNVWFGREEEAGPFGKERMMALMDVVLPHTPRFIGLQEVTPLLAMHLAPSLQAAGYKVFSQPLLQGYGSLVAVRADHIVDGGFVPFEVTNLGRGISWAICQFDGREVLFTTTHAESWCGPEYIGAKERELQLKEMTKYCEQWMKKRPFIDIAIITGDLNWDDWRPRSQGPNTPLEDVVGPEWLDCWKILHPNTKDDPGYTYDGKTNPMLNTGLRRRFDRCLIRTNQKPFSVEAAILIGQDAIPGLMWASRGLEKSKVPVTPSDHYGIVVTIQY